ncbi:NADH dehydrogenase subunit 1 (mitochondrion) [Vespa mandarinia]|uniref:NADH-ubiquinone oxidoreductase chain 1 n=1 Tax=Vespa mandarinia TaxID=7446 RepID=A0A0F7H0S8_VESMA|nr:NADH dehydrogenase subunit 1 [Vespa mandarinia]AKG64619.1 NADH dehydrogenase subunit 1 [Vespa mandarinia]BCD56255.1 NADH dehydrogenase subunit 1 [Vespa mandarinia]BCD56268.1 NADH dehydrogenase subunit 1 [Vespa mandarinia]BCD56281.1 NADH dehydrogenase subunit 1 [Vespa mandarinia]BCD56294.1 NADH dehydrogenase subunit 1 [Vespa mandarinia]
MYVKDMFFIFISLIVMIIGILVGVAFFVLLERKILGYIQDRKGPNKVLLLGVFQSFGDAIKLFVKENVKLYKLNYLFYFMSPMVGFFMVLMLAISIPFNENLFCMNLFLLYMMSCLSLGVYIIMMSGWSSNSMYAILGGVRSVAQSLSYEVSMFLIFFVMFFYVESFKLIDFLVYQSGILKFWYMNFMVCMMMFLSMVAELNRMPFDFIEGESELVSGFNIEYMSGSFTLIFLGEYMMIMVLGILFVLMNFGGNMMNLISILLVLMFMILVIWIRGCLPRMRYDNLMYFCWYYILSLVMLNLLMVFIFKYYLYLMY